MGTASSDSAAPSTTATGMGDGMRRLRGLDLMTGPVGMHPASGMSSLKHNINGLMYGNLPGLKMAAGSNVRWFATSFGSEMDLHTAHWHGNTLLMDGHRLDVVDLLPATFRTLYMQPDTAGVWLFHCHVEAHVDAGMSAYYVVE
jgi:FtsP/CotA-like multicopper oxidase with cupredoxin domain